jgi:hypothetical protein
MEHDGVREHFDGRMQLGKLGVSQVDQAPDRKTGAKPSQSHQWDSGERENQQRLDLIVERSDGLFQLGIDDETAAGPFASRAHAAAVAAQ